MVSKSLLLLSFLLITSASFAGNLKENLYRLAEKYLKQDNYITALEIFTFLGNYKNSPQLKKKVAKFFQPIKVSLNKEPNIRVAFAKNFKTFRLVCGKYTYRGRYENGLYLFRGRFLKSIHLKVDSENCKLFVDRVLKTYLPKGVGVKLINYGGSLLILELPLELYIKGVLPGEVYTSWPLEALKAQAVASRTYALFNLIRARQSGKPFDVGATVNYQVFTGFNHKFPSVERAVNETRGEFLTYNGGIIYAMFHSNSGGCTHSFKELFGVDIGYLPSVREPCNMKNLKWSSWKKNLPKVEVKNFLRRLGVNFTRLEDFRIERTTCGRGKVAIFKTDTGIYKLPLSFFVRLNLHLPSDWFFILSKRGRYYLLAGRGFGHGLGMSQWGAYCLALNGWNYKGILRFYYHSQIKKFY